MTFMFFDLAIICFHISPTAMRKKVNESSLEYRQLAFIYLFILVANSTL